MHTVRGVLRYYGTTRSGAPLPKLPSKSGTTGALHHCLSEPIVPDYYGQLFQFTSIKLKASGYDLCVWMMNTGDDESHAPREASALQSHWRSAIVTFPVLCSQNVSLPHGDLTALGDAAPGVLVSLTI